MVACLLTGYLPPRLIVRNNGVGEIRRAGRHETMGRAERARGGEEGPSHGPATQKRLEGPLHRERCPGVQESGVEVSTVDPPLVRGADRASKHRRFTAPAGLPCLMNLLASLMFLDETALSIVCIALVSVVPSLWRHRPASMYLPPPAAASSRPRASPVATPQPWRCAPPDESSYKYTDAHIYYKTNKDRAGPRALVRDVVCCPGRICAVPRPSSDICRHDEEEAEVLSSPQATPQNTGKDGGHCFLNRYRVPGQGWRRAHARDNKNLIQLI